MCLMFFLSALFTWPSLERRGTRGFLGGRLLRLGVPYLFGISVIMPISLYPVYRATATDPSFAAYVHHLFALPFWPNGPMWFLWQLLALTILASALHAFAPRFVDFIARRSADAAARPVRYYVGADRGGDIGLCADGARLYADGLVEPRAPRRAALPAAALHRRLSRRPRHGRAEVRARIVRGRWQTHGPVEALGRSPDLRRMRSGSASWRGRCRQPGILALRRRRRYRFAVCCITGCFAAFAAALRFGAFPSRILGSASENAFGIYVLHYPFVVWLQYALLSAALFAVAKGAIVFAGSLICSWALAIVFRAVPFGSVLIGGERRAFATTPKLRSPYRRRRPPRYPVATHCALTNQQIAPCR